MGSVNRRRAAAVSSRVVGSPSSLGSTATSKSSTGRHDMLITTRVEYKIIASLYRGEYFAPWVEAEVRDALDQFNARLQARAKRMSELAEVQY